MGASEASYGTYMAVMARLLVSPTENRYYETIEIRSIAKNFGLNLGFFNALCTPSLSSL